MNDSNPSKLLEIFLLFVVAAAMVISWIVTSRSKTRRLARYDKIIARLRSRPGDRRLRQEAFDVGRRLEYSEDSIRNDIEAACAGRGWRQ